MELCPRCKKEQSARAYCVKWKDTDCIRMESIVKEVKA